MATKFFSGTTFSWHKFCPRCHRRIELPQLLKDGKVKAEKGVTLGCGNCKKGKVTVKLG